MLFFLQQWIADYNKFKQKNPIFQIDIIELMKDFPHHSPKIYNLVKINP